MSILKIFFVPRRRFADALFYVNQLGHTALSVVPKLSWLSMRLDCYSAYKSPQVRPPECTHLLWGCDRFSSNYIAPVHCRQTACILQPKAPDFVWSTQISLTKRKQMWTVRRCSYRQQFCSSSTSLSQAFPSFHSHVYDCVSNFLRGE